MSRAKSNTTNSNLGREPTSEEIKDKMANMQASRIDEIYANRQEAKLRMGIPGRIPKGN